MKKIIIIGIGELSEIAFYFFDNSDDYNVVCFATDKEYVPDIKEKFGRKIIAIDDLAEMYAPDDHEAFAAIGYSSMNTNRESTVFRLIQSGYTLASYISPTSAVAEGVAVGANCLIMENVAIQPYASIGTGNIICSGAVISHHCKIDDYCYIAANASIAGKVHIGNHSFVGVGSAVRDEVNIAPYTFIGGGAYIAGDTMKYGVYGRKGTEDAIEKSENDRKGYQQLILNMN